MGKAEREEGLPPLDPGRHALFLDYDGTLVEIAPTPDDARADDPLRGLLAELERRLGGALAIVTGRPVGDIDGFLAPLRLTVAGLHGLHLRRSGDPGGSLPHPPPALAPAVKALAEFAGKVPGTRLEDKRLSVALHYRQAPEAANSALQLAGRLAEGSAGKLRLQTGKMVVELLPAGSDKGTAIAELLRGAPFTGRAPVFAGDDVTDEAGFRAVNALDGLSVRVGTGPTEARYVLPRIGALHGWLAQATRR